MKITDHCRLIRGLIVTVPVAALLVTTLSHCGGGSTQGGGIPPVSERITKALEIMSVSSRVHQASLKYIYKTTHNLHVRDHRVYGICWANTDTIELDQEFVETADMKILVSTILHEIGHCELEHYTNAPENEHAAQLWQQAAMAEVYNDPPIEPPTPNF